MELLEKFRQQYHKVRQIVLELNNQNLSNFKIEYKDNKLHAELNTPEHELTMRFVVLMRRYLNVYDELYYINIWSYLQKHFNQYLTKSSFNEIEKRIAKMNQGQIKFTVNNEVFTAEKIYILISAGEYFNDDKNAQKKLEKLSKSPIVKTFFRHQFFKYTMDGFYLISMLFDVIKTIEKSKEQQISFDNKNESPNICIYCLRSSKPFSSQEHIIPEGLGNEELILPKGFVCDTCNNGILSNLDHYLQEFEPISFLKVIYTQQTKEGKLPKANYQNISVKKNHPRNIIFSAKDKSGWIKNFKEIANGEISFSLDIKGKRFDPKKLGRSLYKIALGMVAFDRGVVAACDQKYNDARAFILEEKDFPNNILILMNAKPNAQVTVWHQELAGGTIFAIDIFGIMFLLNLQPFPIIELQKELEQANFKKFPLGKYGKYGDTSHI